MAESFLQAHPGLRPYVLSDVQPTGTTIGHGAYGSVEEVAIPVCGAAKKIHELLLRSPKITSKFAEELQLMATLRHENIVQFLGIYFFPGSHLPALVMERLLTSLHDLLDPETDDNGQPQPETLPFFTMSLKCSVLHNVASGLAYLHERSSPVIHRDLSARNVLLNSGMVAKIADLGVARIVPGVRAAATMTKAPGASVYMPPEAVAPSASNREKAKYDASIDIFSLGVVAIFTIGETFPCDPLPHNYTDEKSGLLVARTELRRRDRYMANVITQLQACGQLRGDHPLIRLIQQCLQNLPAKRPGIREVLCLLEEARAGISDEESERNKRELVRALQNHPRNQNLEHVLQDLVTENLDLQSRVQEVQQQLQSSEGEKQTIRQQLEAELTRAEETIRREQQQIRELRQQETEKDELVQAMDRVIGDLKEQLQSSEALVADFQKQKGTALRTRLQPASDSELAGATLCPQPIKLNVQCFKKKAAPCEMSRGSATTDHQFAYFLPYSSYTVYSYQWSTEQWEKLPPCPYSDSTLVIIDGSPTAVGGRDVSYNCTNKLFTLQLGQWVEEYPPMNTARSRTAVVSTSDGDYIIVIGGGDDYHWTTTVELFHVSSRRWYELTDLPQPLNFPSATICGHQLHVIGDDDTGYSCSLQALLSSAQPITSQLIRHLISWTSLPRVPASESTAATLCGQLVIIGGCQGLSSANSILQLVDRQWVEIGSMSCGRWRCLVVNPSPDKMMIVGGYKLLPRLISWCNFVEECVVAL